MTTLKDIWPAMTLFYDYIMLFIEKEFSTHKPLLYSFLKVQNKDTKLLIIRKDFISSSYNIHFVSLHHYKVPSSSSSSSSSSSPYNAAVNLKASTSPPFSSSNPRAFDHHPSQRGGGKGRGRLNLAWLALRNLNQKCQDFPLEYMCYIIEYIGV